MSGTERWRAWRAKQVPLPPGDRRHGTIGGYSNYGCRCDDCKAAHNDAVARRARERKAEGLGPDDPRHGTDSGYSGWGCRCDRCRQANAARARARRARQREAS